MLATCRITKRKVVATAVLAIGVCYVGSFLMIYDVFGYPARTYNDWLGPENRYFALGQDIGGVIYFNARPKHYLVYQPLCRVWLGLNGL